MFFGSFFLIMVLINRRTYRTCSYNRDTCKKFYKLRSIRCEIFCLLMRKFHNKITNNLNVITYNSSNRFLRIVNLINLSLRIRRIVLIEGFAMRSFSCECHMVEACADHIFQMQSREFSFKLVLLTLLLLKFAKYSTDKCNFVIICLPKAIVRTVQYSIWHSMSWHAYK